MRTERRVKHYFGIVKMYKNPEFKGFNRGCINDLYGIYEMEVWYDCPRSRQPHKSWKKHRKHQYK